MAKFNSASRYAQVKKESIPVFKGKRSTPLEALQIARVFQDGIFQVEPDDLDVKMFDRCYSFDDVNYISKDPAEQTDFLRKYMRFFKDLEGQCKIVVVASQQTEQENIVDSIYQPVNGEAYPTLDAGIRELIQQKSGEGHQDIGKKMYLVVTKYASSHEEAKLYFDVLESPLQMLFSSMGSQIHRVGMDSRMKLIQQMFKLEDSGFPPTEEMLEKDLWREVVTPAVIDQMEAREYLVIDGKYCCVMTSTEYDLSLYDDKVINILADSTFPVFITIDTQPVPTQIYMDRLTDAHTNVQRNIAEQNALNNKNKQWGVGPTYSTAKKNDELERLMDDAGDNDETVTFISMYVMTYAKTLEELENRVDTLIKRGKNAGYTLQPCDMQQLPALNTLLPIGGRHLSYMMYDFTTTSAVAFNPFKARDLKEDRGYIYGLNRDTKQIIRGDRKKLASPHGIIVGPTGSGKSMLVKATELAQTLTMTTDDVILIDPQNEFKDTVMLCGGSYYDLTPQGEIYMNPYEVPMSVYEADSMTRNKFISTKTNYAISFMNAILTSIHFTINYEVKVTRAVKLMYDTYFDGHDFKKQPTLRTLRDTFSRLLEDARSDEKPIYLEMIDALYKYIDGDINMFSRESNLQMDNRLVGFGLHEVPDNVWEPIMVTVMHFMMQRIEFNQSRRVAAHLLIDEAQYLCNKGSSAQQLLEAVETYRKFGGIITFLVQNLDRVLEHPELRDMFSNCGYKCFIGLSSNEVNTLSAIQALSASERDSIVEGGIGRGLMVWSGQVYKFDVFIDHKNTMYPLFNTDFHNR